MVPSVGSPNNEMDDEKPQIHKELRRTGTILLSAKKTIPLIVSEYDSALDKAFNEKILIKYLTNIFTSLASKNDGGDYIEKDQLLEYMNLPKVIGKALLRQINQWKPQSHLLPSPS